MSIRTLTQEDPIGLAGGLNLYGFADGDPINFSDPFGLCDDPDDPKCKGMAQEVVDAAKTKVKNAAASTLKAVGDLGNAIAEPFRKLADHLQVATTQGYTATSWNVRTGEASNSVVVQGPPQVGLSIGLTIGDPSSQPGDVSQVYGWRNAGVMVTSRGSTIPADVNWNVRSVTFSIGGSTGALPFGISTPLPGSSR